MQDRYAGDIGDFVKIALLRRLSPGYRLGVAWWLATDDRPNNDGRHIDYLDDPGKWRLRDPDLFDALATVVASRDRRVAALQEAQLLPGATYFEKPVPRVNRSEWMAELSHAFADRDLVFADPDNGLEPAKFLFGRAKSVKSIAVSEIQALRRPGRTLIIYHHQSRFKGGHPAEIIQWAERLRSLGFNRVDVLRAGILSARAFFILDAPPKIRLGAEQFVREWGKRLSWYPDSNEATGRNSCSA